ncbi:hypothetical protein AVEN_227054-1 [Araneus ventricosus]|uniref:Uncharacterized protein n=1 Tax=Araneus ventricosus TaxID=182803 RepID=A0A4Y2RQN1_ARAVE|nr:hypothetical protein AVEN_227054-1 [Araneus ventricosus]
MFLYDSAAWMPNLSSRQMKISPDDPKDVSVIHDQIQPHHPTAELQTITGILPLRTRAEHDVLYKYLVQVFILTWMRECEEATTSRHTYDMLSKEAPIHSSGCCHEGSSIHYAASCPLTLSYNFKSPPTIHQVASLRNLIENPHT